MDKRLIYVISQLAFGQMSVGYGNFMYDDISMS